MKRNLQLALLLFLGGCGSVIAEEIVDEGAMTDVAEQIGNLVHLKWLEQRIGIDQEHWAAVVSKPEEEKQNNRLQAMINRGVPAEIAKKMIADQPQRRFRRADFLTESPEGELFEELKTASGALSGGSGGGGEERHWSGHGNGLHMTMHRNSLNEEFRFMIREGTAPFQEFLIEDHPQKGMRIQFTSANRELLFSQSPDGTVRVAHVSDQRNDAFQCASYEEMVLAHADFAADLGTLLESIGANRPFTNYDARIVNTVARLLHRPDSETAAVANAAIEKLNSQSFQVRKATQLNIEENFLAWRDVIRERLSDPELNLEIRNSLKSIQLSVGAEPSTAEAFVRQRKLLENVDYLSAILEEVPESVRPSIQARLSELKTK